MRICFIGRAIASVISRAQGLAQRGHDVTLITIDRVDEPIEGLTVRCPKRGRLGCSPTSKLDAVLALPQLYRLIRDCKADVYYNHFAAGPVAALVLAAKVRPLAVHVMGGDVLEDERRRHSQIYRSITDRMLRTADLVTANSRFLAERARERGAAKERLMTVVWGVDLQRFQPTDASALRDRYAINGDDPVIFCPRIMRPLYNTHLIIEAMSVVLVKHSNAKLVLLDYLADASYRKRVRATIDQRNLRDAVRVIDAVPYDRMPAHLSMADVVVSAPSSDGMPNTVLEAMACGTPTVVTNLPRYEEFFRDRHSSLFFDLNADAIAAAINELLDDDVLRDRLIRNARADVVRKANFEEEVKRVDKRLRQLAGWHRPPTNNA